MEPNTLAVIEYSISSIWIFILFFLVGFSYNWIWITDYKKMLIHCTIIGIIIGIIFGQSNLFELIKWIIWVILILLLGGVTSLNFKKWIKKK